MEVNVIVVANHLLLHDRAGTLASKYIYIYIFIYIYLKLACHDEQNGSQSFNLQARIPELWRFKAQKVGKV